MSESDVRPAKPKGGLFFYVKVLTVFCLLIALSVFIAVYYVYYNLSRDGRLEKIIMERASAATGMQISFSGYELSFPGIEVKNIRVATDSAELKLDAAIDSVKLRPDLWAAVNGELIIDSLIISSASADLETGVAGKSPPTAKEAGVSAPFDPASIRLPFNSVELSHVRVSILQRATGERREVALKNASLSRSVLSSSMPFSLDAAVAGLATVKADGRLYWPANVLAEINIAAENMAEIKKLVPVEYHKQFALVKSAGLSVKLRYNLSGGDLNVESCSLNIEPGIKADASAVMSSLSPLNGSATIKLAPIDVAVLWPLAKDFVPAEHGLKIGSGRVSGKVDLALKDGSLSDMRASVLPENFKIEAKALPEPIMLKKGQISYVNGKIDFSGFNADFAGSAVELASGKLSLDPLEFDGDLKLAVNIDSGYKLAREFLSPEAKNVTPGGKADFSGKIRYDSKGVKVNGSLKSQMIALKESTTGAAATIEKIDVGFVDLSPAKGQIKINSLEVKGVGAAVKVTGLVKNDADMGFDVTANGNLNIDEFAGLAAGLFKLPVRPGQFKGALTLDVKLGGRMSDLKPGGSLVLKDVFADLSDRGLLISKLNGAASADTDKLVVDNLAAELLGGKVKISGSLKNFKKPAIDVKASVTAADLGQIRSFIKKNVPEMPDDIEFSGLSDLTVALTGNIAEPALKGDAVLKNVRFFHPAVMRPVENISGPISFDNKGLTAKGVSAGWGKSRAVVNGQLKDWAKFISDFKYTVNPLDVTDAAGFFLKDTGYVVQGSGVGSGNITGPVEKIRLDGVASVPAGLAIAPISEKGEVFRFPFKNLRAAFVYHDSVFSVSSADFELFSGRISGSGKVNLASEPLKFDYDSKVTNVLTQEFLKENTKFHGVLTGGLNGTFAGAGTTMGLNSINGKASLAMPSGTYNSPPILKQIAERLNAPQLASGTINNVAGEYNIAGGRISSNNVVGTSNHGKVVFLGSIGLDATIDGEAKIQITRQACQQSNVLRELVGNDPHLDVPVTVKGSMMSPSLGMPIDRMLKEAAERRGKEAVKKEAGKLLDKVFGGSKKSEPASPQATATATPQVSSPAPAQQPPAQAPQKKIENQLKDLGKEINKIFKRK